MRPLCGWKMWKQTVCPTPDHQWLIDHSSARWFWWSNDKPIGFQESEWYDLLRSSQTELSPISRLRHVGRYQPGTNSVGHANGSSRYLPISHSTFRNYEIGFWSESTFLPAPKYAATRIPATDIQTVLGMYDEHDRRTFACWASHGYRGLDTMEGKSKENPSD